MKVALVAIVKQEDHLVEWCRYHMSLGFDKIFLYCNDWMPDYALPNSVDVIPRAGTRQQMKVYNDWIKVYGPSYDYVMFLDADEFLYLVSWNKVQDMLKQVTDGQKSMVINWVFFGSKEEPFMFHSVVRRFCYREDKVNKHVKTILKLGSGNYMVSPHNGNQVAVSPEHIKVEGPFNVAGTMINAFVAHYYYQDVRHWLKKVGRGRADSIRTRDNEIYDEHDHNKVFDPRLEKTYAKLLPNTELLARTHTTLNPGSNQRTIN